MKRRLRRKQRRQRAADQSALTEIRQSMQQAYSVFNHTTEPDLLEAAILEIRSLQSKYSHTLRQLKETNGGNGT